MSSCTRIVVAVALVSIGLSEPASAYIGPGAGLSMLSAFWALIVAIFAALGFLILHPLRRWLRRKDANLSVQSAKVSDQDRASEHRA